MTYRIKNVCLPASAILVAMSLGCGRGSAPMSPTDATTGVAAGVVTVPAATTPALFGASGVDFSRCLQGAADQACRSGARFSAQSVGSAAATAPGAPLNLSGSSSGSTVMLTWNAPIAGDPVITYIIEAGSAPGLSDLANFATSSTATTFSASGIGAGSYYVRIRALNNSGTSAASNEWILIVGGAFCTSPPGPPTALAITASGATVSLAWAAPASAGCPATSYILQAGSSPGLTNLANSNVGNTTSYVATGVGGGIYYVRVRAANAYGQSAASNEFTLTVGSTPTPLPTPTTVGISPTAIDLGASGGCTGGVLTTNIAVTAPPGTTWTVGIAGSLAPPDVVGGAVLDRTGGTGSGTVKLTVTLNPQRPIISCNNTSRYAYGDTVYFVFSPGGYFSTNVTYTYIAVF